MVRIHISTGQCAIIHKAKATLNFLHVTEIEVMPWLTKRSDPNPKVNAWGYAPNAVYGEGKQCSSTGEELPLDRLQKLIGYMKSRVSGVIQKSCGQTYNC